RRQTRSKRDWSSDVCLPILRVIGMRVLSRKERARLAESPPTTAQVTSVKPMRTGSAVLRAVGGIAVLVLIALPATSLRLNLPDEIGRASWREVAEGTGGADR